jgi:hypothetical protein
LPIQQWLAQHGTLVIAVLTADGLVIVADKRTNDRVRGDLDTQIKIEKIDRIGAFSTTGLPRFLNPITFAELFSAERSVADYFRITGAVTSMDSHWIPIAKRLMGDFDNFLLQLPFTHWPGDGDLPDYALFQVVFFYYDVDYRISTLRFCYRKKFPKPVIQFTKHDTPSAILLTATPEAFGNITVFNEIKSGQDSRFSDVRADPIIKKFFKQSLKAKTVSVPDAVLFAKEMIRVTSRRLHILDQSPFHVGEAVDIAIIKIREGFKWLEKG